MIKRFSWILSGLLLWAICAKGAVVTATITVIGTPFNGDTFVCNGNTRTWTNTASTPVASWITIASGAGPTATNLYMHIAANPYVGPFLTLGRTGTNVITLFSPNGTLTITPAAWFTVSYSTSQTSNVYALPVPPFNVAGQTNRTNNGHWLVDYLNDYVYTNSIRTNANVASNYLTKGASPQQYVSSPVQFNGTLRVSGAGGVAMTNGITHSLTNINPILTNGINFNDAFRSDGPGANSLQLGSSSQSLGTRSLSVGNGAIATNTDSIAIGTAARATNANSVAIGSGTFADGSQAVALGSGGTIARGAGATALGGDAVATAGALAVGGDAGASGTNSLAIGNNALTAASGYAAIALGSGPSADANNAIAIGTGTTATHSNSVALGAGAATTDTNQIRLGTSAEKISIPGILLVSGTQSNTTFRGTNIAGGSWSFPRADLTSIANGNNIAIPLGTNVFIRLAGSVSAEPTLCGFVGGATTGGTDGQWVRIHNDLGYAMTIAQNTVDPVPANRVETTPLGSDISVAINGWADLFYSSSDSRWHVVAYYPINIAASATNALSSVQTNGAAPAYVVGTGLTNILFTTGITGYQSGASAILGVNFPPGSSTNALVSTNGTTLGALVGTFDFNSGITGYLSGAKAILGVNFGPSVNGEISVTNATKIGLPVDSVNNTNRLRSLQGGNGIVLTNQGTNIPIAIDPAVVASQANLTAASNSVITLLDGKVDELNGVATNLTTYTGSPGMTVVPLPGKSTNSLQVLNTNSQAVVFVDSNSVFTASNALAKGSLRVTAGLTNSGDYSGLDHYTRSIRNTNGILNGGYIGSGVMTNQGAVYLEDNLISEGSGFNQFSGPIYTPLNINSGSLWITNVLMIPTNPPTTDAFGEVGGKINAWAAGRGALQVFDGSQNTYLVGALATDVPVNGQVPTWGTGGTITWEDPNAALLYFTNQTWVEMFGNDSTALRGDPTKPYRSLTNALANARDGDTINLGVGQWTNTIPMVLSNNMTVRGVNWNRTILRGTNGIYGEGAMLVPADNCVIENLFIDNTFTNDFAATFGTVTNSSFYTVAQRHSTNVFVRRVKMFGFTDCVYVDSASVTKGVTMTFEQCKFSGAWDVNAQSGNLVNLIYRECDFLSTNQSLLSSQAGLSRAVSVSGGFLTLINSTISCSNGISETIGLFLSGGTISLVNTRFFTSSTNAGTPVWDIKRSGGTATVFGLQATNRVSGIVGYDPFPVTTNLITFAKLAQGSGMLTNDGAGILGWMAVPAGGGGGGTNYPAQLNMFNGTNINVGLGIRQSWFMWTNASFKLTFTGTPLNGEQIDLAVLNTNFPASILYLTNTAGIYDPSVGSNVTVFALPSQAIRYFTFVSTTNSHAAAGQHWEMRSTSQKEFELAPGTGIGFSTNNNVLTINAGVETNRVFVSPSGDDSTGLRNDRNKPFKTLTNAMAATKPGDAVMMSPGTFTIALDIYLDVSNNVSLVGAGMKATYIQTEVDLTAIGCAIVPGNNSYIANFSTTNNDTFGAAMGSVLTGGKQKIFTNAVIDSVEMWGQSDSWYVFDGAQSKRCDYEIRNCVIRSSFDHIVHQSTSDSVFRVINTVFEGIGPYTTLTSPQNGVKNNAGTMYMSGGFMRLFGTNANRGIISANGTTSYVAGVTFKVTGGPPGYPAVYDLENPFSGQIYLASPYELSRVTGAMLGPTNLQINVITTAPGITNVLPTTQGTAGQVMTNDGNGKLNWGNVGAAGSTTFNGGFISALTNIGYATTNVYIDLGATNYAVFCITNVSGPVNLLFTNLYLGYNFTVLIDGENIDGGTTASNMLVTYVWPHASVAAQWLGYQTNTWVTSNKVLGVSGFIRRTNSVIISSRE